jgi:hypothetical protein
VVEGTTVDGAQVWVERGLAVAAASPEAGDAWFALESRTSVGALGGADGTAALADVQAELAKLVLMLSGQRARPVPAGAFTLRPPLAPADDAEAVPLPGTVALLATWEENARLYHVVAALAAGRREFGTEGARGALAARASAGAPAALEPLFRLTDGWRVAARLAAVYPGLAADLRWAGDAIVARAGAALPGAEAALDAVFALALAGPGPVPRWLAGLTAAVGPALAPLAAPGATALDALAAAESLAPLFAATTATALAGALAAAEETLALDGGGADVFGTPGDDAAAGNAPADEPPRDAAVDASVPLDGVADDTVEGGRALTPDELAQLLAAGAALREAHGAGAQAPGLWVTQLLGKQLGAAARVAESGAPLEAPRLARPSPPPGAVWEYDEWDHCIADYRPRWCRLREVDLGGDAGTFFAATLAHRAALVAEVRRHQQRVPPERRRRVRGLEDGEDVDLTAAVEARADRRAQRPPRTKLYVARRLDEREVATLFLLDMSASTDDAAGRGAGGRIIDIVKETLVVTAAALEEIGDAYAIYGFSGQGRDNVEVYPVKGFGEPLGPAVRARIGAIEPRGSTRMGTAIRHAIGKLRAAGASARHLLLLSDGFPQDLDYGTDRQSHTYGIRDTAVALREAERAGVRPFCVTVDLAGHDYLREMCDPERYLVIEDVTDLPRELPKTYRRVVRAA